MQFFLAFVAFGVAFIITRIITSALFRAISPPPPDASHWQWWGTYASILISIVVASYAMSLVDRRTMRR